MKNGSKFWKRISLVAFVVMMAYTSITIGSHILEGKTPTLGNYALIHFAGYLFFLTLPVEALVPYIMSYGHNFLIVFGIAMATALTAQTVDYLIGLLMPKNILREIVGENKLKKAVKKVTEHYKKVIFVFNLFPLSSPIIVLAAGVLRIKPKHTFFYSFLGLFIKYFLIIFTVFQATNSQ